MTIEGAYGKTEMAMNLVNIAGKDLDEYQAAALNQAIFYMLEGVLEELDSAKKALREVQS